MDNQVGAVVLVEPFGAGGGVDVVARPLAAELAEILKARVTVDNRPGEGATAVPVPARPSDAIDATIGRVAAGDADYAMSPIPIAAPHLVAGTLLALGVSGVRRSPLLPDVPTLAEAGATGFDFPIWYGTWAPAGTPRPTVSALSAGISDALETPRLRSWLAGHGAEPAEYDAVRVREVRGARGRTCARNRQGKRQLTRK